MPTAVVYDNEYALPILGGKNHPALKKTYSLQPHERRSIEEIRKRLRSDSPDKEVIRSHAEYLEALATKVSQIISEEEREGFVNWDLKKDVEAMRLLYQQVMERLSQKT
ncbi:MAG: hypothetical protein HY518_01815 [Candidatus Aenigmarchaeota archaeon]|nr:hypothetical protein [Candidatus Aenigmarchaeota archaeon]